MPETFAQLLDKASKTGPGQIAASHLIGQIDVLNKMYDDEATRDAAYILATDWLQHGSPLRKAAAASWAKEKHIPVGDQPDPEATPPKPNDLSDGIDAPKSGDKAPGAGPAANQLATNPKDDDGKKHTSPAPGGKKAHSTIDALRRMKQQRVAPAAHAGSSATAAAYQAGVRDATHKHAHAAHRIGAMAARHAFSMGAETGKRMAGAAHAAAGQMNLPVNQQRTITHPGTTAPAVMKSDRAAALAKLGR